MAAVISAASTVKWCIVEALMELLLVCCQMMFQVISMGESHVGKKFTCSTLVKLVRIGDIPRKCHPILEKVKLASNTIEKSLKETDTSSNGGTETRKKEEYFCSV